MCSFAPCPHIYTHARSHMHTRTYTHTLTDILTHTQTRHQYDITSLTRVHDDTQWIHKHMWIYTHAHARDITLLMSSCLCQHNDITLTSLWRNAYFSNGSLAPPTVGVCDYVCMTSYAHPVGVIDMATPF